MAQKAYSLSHAKRMCKCHIAFTPKYRRKVIYNQIRSDLGEIFGKLCQYKGIEIIEGHLMPDRVHMLLAIPPKYSVSSVMGCLRGKSSLMIFGKHANVKHGRIGVLHRRRLSAVFHELRCTDGVEIVDVERGDSEERVHGRSRTRIAQAAGIESHGVEVLECTGVRRVTGDSREGELSLRAVTCGLPDLLDWGVRLLGRLPECTVELCAVVSIRLYQPEPPAGRRDAGPAHSPRAGGWGSGRRRESRCATSPLRRVGRFGGKSRF